MRIFCPQCGTENDSDKVNFCPKCGFSISSIAFAQSNSVPAMQQAEQPNMVQPTFVQPAPVQQPVQFAPQMQQIPPVIPTAAVPQAQNPQQPVFSAPSQNVTEYESFVTMPSPEDNIIPTCEPDTVDHHSVPPAVTAVPTAPPDAYADGLQSAVPVLNGQPIYQMQPDLIPDDTKKKNKKKKEKKAKQPKANGRKHRLPWILRFLIANIIIFGSLIFLWFAVGNYFTLYLHSEEVVDTLNSGSLELAGTQNVYTELPNYIKDMLSEEHFESDYGPITKAVLPYIHAERKSINGLFGSSSVTYTITAPDLEFWLLGIDPSTVTDENVLLSMLEQYVTDAPKCTSTVEVQYARKHFFSIDWQGNYYTPEFTDAICGGFNSGYNVIYQRAMDELNEALYGKAEE